ENGRANNQYGQLPNPVLYSTVNRGRKVGRPRKPPEPPVTRLDTTVTTAETRSSSSSSISTHETRLVSNPIGIMPAPSENHRIPHLDFVAKQSSINITKMFSGKEDEDLEDWF
ncbi:unnamed protein product, partial [Brachionus calyciflorus]